MTWGSVGIWKILITYLLIDKGWPRQGWNIVLVVPFLFSHINLFQIRKSFLEASALDSTNVESAFTSLVTEIFHSVSQVRLCPPLNLIIYLIILTLREESVMASESSPSQDWEMGRRLFYQSQQIRNLNEAVVVLGGYFDWDLLKFLWYTNTTPPTTGLSFHLSNA